MRTGGSGAPSKVKWAYFGKQKGASGVVRDLGWVRVGSSKWKSYVTAVHTAGRTGQGPHRPGLVPTKYRVVPAGKNPNFVTQVTGGARPGSGSGRGAGATAPGKTGVTHAGKSGSSAGSTPTPPARNNPTSPKSPKAPTTHNMNVMAKAIGNPNVGAMTPMRTAVNQADLQFGSQISDTKLAQAEGVAQHAQNLHDIQQWYNQINGANTAAQQANQAAVKSGQAQDQGNMLAALQAIGGSANASAGGVAAAGLNQQSLLQGLGQSQDAFSNLLRPMLAQDQAGQMSAQSALDSQAARSLQQQLADLQGQRGNAIVANQMAIRQGNNALAQTRFGNTMSKLQAMQAATALAGSQRLQAAQLTGQHIANAAAAQQVMANGTGGRTAWTAMKPADKYGAVTSAIKALGAGATAQKVAVMLQHMGGWSPVNTQPFINTFFQ